MRCGPCFALIFCSKMLMLAVRGLGHRSQRQGGQPRLSSAARRSALAGAWGQWQPLWDRGENISCGPLGRVGGQGAMTGCWRWPTEELQGGDTGSRSELHHWWGPCEVYYFDKKSSNSTGWKSHEQKLSYIHISRISVLTATYNTVNNTMYHRIKWMLSLKPHSSTKSA